MPWLRYSLAAFFSLLLGVLIDRSVKNWPILTLKYDVDVFSALVSLISLVVTLFVAFWVTTVLEKQSTDTRTEKDIIIKHVDLLYLIIEEVREKVRSGTMNYPLAASNMKRLNVNTSSVVQSMVKAAIETEENHELLIQGEVATVKDLLTNSKPNDPDLLIVNNIITFSQERQILVDTHLDKVRNEIYKFELAINKA